MGHIFVFDESENLKVWNIRSITIDISSESKLAPNEILPDNSATYDKFSPLIFSSIVKTGN